jgi:hypothetical protein
MWGITPCVDRRSDPEEAMDIGEIVREVEVLPLREPVQIPAESPEPAPTTEEPART